MMMAMISRIWIRRPSAGISSQPKSQIRMMIRAIHNRIDMHKTPEDERRVFVIFMGA
jgi:hypothetical protein